MAWYLDLFAVLCQAWIGNLTEHAAACLWEAFQVCKAVVVLLSNTRCIDEGENEAGSGLHVIRTYLDAYS